MREGNDEERGRGELTEQTVRGSINRARPAPHRRAISDIIGHDKDNAGKKKKSATYRKCSPLGPTSHFYLTSGLCCKRELFQQPEAKVSWGVRSDDAGGGRAHLLVCFVATYSGCRMVMSAQVCRNEGMAGRSQDVVSVRPSGGVGQVPVPSRLRRSTRRPVHPCFSWITTCGIGGISDRAEIYVTLAPSFGGGCFRTTFARGTQKTRTTNILLSYMDVDTYPIIRMIGPVYVFSDCTAAKPEEKTKGYHTCEIHDDDGERAGVRGK